METITKKRLIVLLFIVFLFLRLFVNMPSLRLASDNLKFLILAKNFPNHTLNNNQLYLQHGPILPILIHYFNLFIENGYFAAITISLISASITFYILYKLFMLLSRNFYITFGALFFYTLSVDLIISAHKVTRESFVIMLIVLTLYFYIRGLKFYDGSSFAFASLFGGLLGLTADHAIFIFPAMALSYIFFNKEKISIVKWKFPNLKYALLPVVVALIAYGSWLGVRAYTYSNNEYYPAGLEGTPIKISNFNFFSLIDPILLDDYDSNVGVLGGGILPRIKSFAFNVGYMFNLEPFSIPRGLNFSTISFLLYPWHIIYLLLIYLPLAAIAIYGFTRAFIYFLNKRTIHNNETIFIVLLFLIFIFPITQRVTSPRYIYPAYIFFFYVMGYCVFHLSRKISSFKNYSKPITIVLFIALLLLIPLWYYHNNNFIFNVKHIIVNPNTTAYVLKNINSNDGIMAQPGYSYSLIYASGNRVVGMPPKPENMLKFIEYYNIKWVVFGRFFTDDKYHFSVDSVEFIKNNPGKFKPVAAIKEDYRWYLDTRDPASTDEVYIYKILR